ncbi:MAG: ABC transporter permease [Lachnospiraceae bacterium]|nr:ABC transporter permease [Lachnospiraceae bacterium]
MRRFFYAKLAWSNIRKNARMYIPYMLTFAGTVMMYEIMQALSMNKSMLTVSGGASAQMVMNLGSWVIAIFAVVFLFYTNSFLIKRRKKEFGLFNILGMEKRHLAKMVLWESIYSYVGSMAAGLLGGILLSRLAYLAVERILQINIFMKYEMPPKAIWATIPLFGIIALINLANTLFQIRLSKPVELLKGSEVGEKEPKTKWILTLIGVICLGIGYYLAATVENPVTALMLFFVAVILVIVGTYALFTAGSIAILKMMRRSKKFYYKPNHFISVSGMMYRMKQNAAGLASICVLSTGVLILISSTICLYLGTEDTIRIQNPRNIAVSVQDADENSRDAVQKMVHSMLEKHAVEAKEELSYFSDTYVLKQEEGRLTAFPNQSQVNYDQASVIQCIMLKDYNRLAGTEEQLEPGQVLLYGTGDEIGEDSIQIADTVYRIKEHLKSFPIPQGMEEAITNTYYLVMPNQEAVEQMAAQLLQSEPDSGIQSEWVYYYGVDLTAESDVQIEMTKELRAAFDASGIEGAVHGAAISRSSTTSTFGGFLFLGIFLGILFLMGTVLIIYYKQISEGYDDRERYQIMQKVGMSRREVRKSIRSQVLTVFYMPLVMAGIHILFAFNMIKKILNMFGLFNIQLFILCTAGTIVLFAILYCLVYAVTAKAYYKIIS